MKFEFKLQKLEFHHVEWMCFSELFSCEVVDFHILFTVVTCFTSQVPSHLTPLTLFFFFLMDINVKSLSRRFSIYPPCGIFLALCLKIELQSILKPMWIISFL